MPQRIGKQIHELLLASEHIRLIPHPNPDGDACGAVAALGLYLKNHLKKVEIFCTTPVPRQYAFLPLMDTVTTDTTVWNNPSDVVLVCDSGDPVYAGIDTYLQKNTHQKLVNIDHHPRNTQFGDLNLVLTDRSSTCEVLYEYFVANQVTITPDMATALLCGIVYDTGSFSNSATSGRSLAVAGTLVRQGASMKNIVKFMYRDKNLNVLKLWGTALSNLAYDKTLDIVSLSITLRDMLSCGVDEDGANGIANFMNTLKDGRVHMVFREKPNGMIKVSMRTTHEDIDLSEIAQAFNGGGHRKAAGFSIHAPIEKVYEQMLPTLNKYLKKV
jgi:phosphoesterase RecJ-like protein